MCIKIEAPRQGSPRSKPASFFMLSACTLPLIAPGLPEGSFPTAACEWSALHPCLEALHKFIASDSTFSPVSVQQSDFGQLPNW